MTKLRIAILALAAILLSTAPVFAADTGAAAGTAQEASGTEEDAADVIVLLDVSQSALPYFQDVTDYVVSSVVEDYLRLGDTFHLLSFGETTQVEVAQRISTEADVKSVLGRLYLLVPLARYTDFVGALGYLDQYVSDLPESRRKVIVIITDGVHNPPPSSPTFGMSSDQAAAEIEAEASKIRANGWPVHIIQLPFPKPGEPGAPAASSPESKGKSLLDVAAKALSAEVSDYSKEGKTDLARRSLSLPSAEFPGPLGKRDYAFSFPLKISNGSDSSVGLELDRVRLGDSDILRDKVFLTLQGGHSGTMEIPVLLPDSLPLGDARLQVSLHFGNGIRVSPDTGVLELTLARSPLGALLRSGARIALFAVVLVLVLAAILGIALILRRMPKRAEEPVAAAVLQAEAGATGSSASSQAQRTAAPVHAATVSPAAGAARRVAPGLPQPQTLDRREAQATLASAATAAAADSAARDGSARASAKEIAASRREEAARSSSLLAEAARAAKAGSGAGSSRAPAQGVDEHEAAIEDSSAALLAQRKAESERTVALLSEAAGRRGGASRPAEAIRSLSAYAPKIVKPGTIEVELLVAEQNPHIGSRNVHSLSAGLSKSVGGGASDFLVFLVSVPRHAAELHFDGEKLTFVPLKGELFPELQGPVPDCMGKDIPMISRSGYPLTLRFTAYEKPVDKINRLLHCIETPGL
jgi:hypothetical protein